MVSLRIVFVFFIAALGAAAAQAQTQDAASIQAAVEAHLLHKAEGYPGTAEVEVSEPRVRDHAQCERLEVTTAAGQPLRSRVTTTVRCFKPESWTLHVPATVRIQGFYYVANRTINVGELISLDDLNPREGDLLRLSSNVVTDPSRIVGSMAGQRLNNGSIIKANSLRDPQSIQRGQAVRTVARGLGFVATGEGQALQDGAPGSQIQVRSSSGQVITGTVLDATTVQVLM